MPTERFSICNVYSNFICDSPQLETTQISISRRRYEQIVEEYCSLIQNILVPEVCNNIDESPKHNVRQRWQILKRTFCVTSFIWITKQTKHICGNTNLNNCCLRGELLTRRLQNGILSGNENFSILPCMMATCIQLAKLINRTFINWSKAVFIHIWHSCE